MNSKKKVERPGLGKKWEYWANKCLRNSMLQSREIRVPVRLYWRGAIASRLAYKDALIDAEYKLEDQIEVVWEPLEEHLEDEAKRKRGNTKR